MTKSCASTRFTHCSLPRFTKCCLCKNFLLIFDWSRLQLSLAIIAQIFFFWNFIASLAMFCFFERRKQALTYFASYYDVKCFFLLTNFLSLRDFFNDNKFSTFVYQWNCNEKNQLLPRTTNSDREVDKTTSNRTKAQEKYEKVLRVTFFFLFNWEL